MDRRAVCRHVDGKLTLFSPRKQPNHDEPVVSHPVGRGFAHAGALHLTETLARQGWAVEWVATAEAAMQRIHAADLDLIVLDFYLPGVRGDALCQRIRLSTARRDLPILMLTAEDPRTAEVHLLESGADDFVTKSADEDILVARIRALLAKSPRRATMPGGEEPPIRPARLLTIDDSATYQAYLRGELAAEGYSIEQATSARDGLVQVQRGNFDCVIVDLVMPEINGIEVCRQISELRRETNTWVAVLMLTGRENKEDLTRSARIRRGRLRQQILRHGRPQKQDSRAIAPQAVAGRKSPHLGGAQGQGSRSLAGPRRDRGRRSQGSTQ